MRWSEEQSAIINSRDERLVVEARAGTGKTTTMVGYTEARERMKYGYLVFNKANREEAQARFPENVTPLTSHGLAYRGVGYRYRGKLGDPKAVDISQAFGVKYQEAGQALDLLKRFFTSDQDSLEAIAGASSPDALPLAQDVWAAMRDRQNGDILMPHDGYLKIFALEGRPLPYDALVFDEAQDANAVTLSILKQQQKPLVVVGDPYQSIYSFRGAINALQQFDGTRHFLTKSYRFGPEVAAAANAVLRQFGERMLLEGCGASSSVQHGASPTGTYTFLARTNAGVIQKAINSPGKRLHFVGGLESYRTERILDVHRLYAHSGGDIRDPELRKLKSFDQVLAYAEQINDPELKAVINLVQNQDFALPERIADLARRSVPADQAEIVLTTLHRSKGLEWDTVELGECFDWEEFVKARSAGKIDEYREELNLLYVGASRARKELNINKTLQEAIREAAAAPSVAAEKVIRVSTGPSVEVRGEEDCRFLGDMHTDYDDDGPQPPEEIMQPLRQVLCDRSCFIVEQNGRFGVLVEEIVEDTQTGGSQGLASPVGKLAGSHPAAEVWLTSGRHIEAGCTAVRAFVPAAAVNAGRIQGLSVAMAALAGRESRAKQYEATAEAMSM
ncbi:UvrD-helicase domain-containing protein [Xanthobacter sp. DSM 14520]|uniref:UvrD-helicase domain-containing protein n=1 Tax=Xanthobacter autotrophicus (strain ATCC BAA-1158 / Py2) TaxID=78245 RepID=UPI0037280F75